MYGSPAARPALAPLALAVAAAVCLAASVAVGVEGASCTGAATTNLQSGDHFVYSNCTLDKRFGSTGSTVDNVSLTFRNVQVANGAVVRLASAALYDNVHITLDNCTSTAADNVDASLFKFEEATFSDVTVLIVNSSLTIVGSVAPQQDAVLIEMVSATFKVNSRIELRGTTVIANATRGGMTSSAYIAGGTVQLHTTASIVVDGCNLHSASLSESTALFRLDGAGLTGGSLRVSDSTLIVSGPGSVVAALWFANGASLTSGSRLRISRVHTTLRSTSQAPNTITAMIRVDGGGAVTGGSAVEFAGLSTVNATGSSAPSVWVLHASSTTVAASTISIGNASTNASEAATNAGCALLIGSDPTPRAAGENGDGIALFDGNSTISEGAVITVSPRGSVVSNVSGTNAFAALRIAGATVVSRQSELSVVGVNASNYLVDAAVSSHALLRLSATATINNSTLIVDGFPGQWGSFPVIDPGAAVATSSSSFVHLDAQARLMNASVLQLRVATLDAHGIASMPVPRLRAFGTAAVILADSPGVVIVDSVIDVDWSRESGFTVPSLAVLSWTSASLLQLRSGVKLERTSIGITAVVITTRSQRMHLIDLDGVQSGSGGGASANPLTITGMQSTALMLDTTASVALLSMHGTWCLGTLTVAGTNNEFVVQPSVQFGFPAGGGTAASSDIAAFRIAHIHHVSSPGAAGGQWDVRDVAFRTTTGGFGAAVAFVRVENVTMPAASMNLNIRDATLQIASNWTVCAVELSAVSTEVLYVRLLISHTNITAIARTASDAIAATTAASVFRIVGTTLKDSRSSMSVHGGDVLVTFAQLYNGPVAERAMAACFDVEGSVLPVNSRLRAVSGATVHLVTATTDAVAFASLYASVVHGIVDALSSSIRLERQSSTTSRPSSALHILDTNVTGTSVVNFDRATISMVGQNAHAFLLLVSGSSSVVGASIDVWRSTFTAGPATTVDAQVIRVADPAVMSGGTVVRLRESTVVVRTPKASEVFSVGGAVSDTTFSITDQTNVTITTEDTGQLPRLIKIDTTFSFVNSVFLVTDSTVDTSAANGGSHAIGIRGTVAGSNFTVSRSTVAARSAGGISAVDASVVYARNADISGVIVGISDSVLDLQAADTASVFALSSVTSLGSGSAAEFRATRVSGTLHGGQTISGYTTVIRTNLKEFAGRVQYTLTDVDLSLTTELPNGTSSRTSVMNLMGMSVGGLGFTVTDSYVRCQPGTTPPNRGGGDACGPFVYSPTVDFDLPTDRLSLTRAWFRGFSTVTSPTGPIRDGRGQCLFECSSLSDVSSSSKGLPPWLVAGNATSLCNASVSINNNGDCSALRRWSGTASPSPSKSHGPTATPWLTISPSVSRTPSPAATSTRSLASTVTLPASSSPSPSATSRSRTLLTLALTPTARRTGAITSTPTAAVQGAPTRTTLPRQRTATTLPPPPQSRTRTAMPAARTASMTGAATATVTASATPELSQSPSNNVVTREASTRSQAPSPRTATPPLQPRTRTATGDKPLPPSPPPPTDTSPPAYSPTIARTVTVRIPTPPPSPPPPPPPLRTSTLSVVPEPPATPAPALPQPVKRATTAAVATTSTVASVSASPASALQMARVLGTLELAERCRNARKNDGADDVQAVKLLSDETKPEFPQALMPFLRIGEASSGGWQRGTVVGNVLFVLLACGCIVGVTAALVIAKVLRSKHVPDTEPFWARVRVAGRMPASFIVASALAVDGCVSSGVTLWLHPGATGGPGDWFIGGVGTAVGAAIIGAGLFVAYTVVFAPASATRPAVVGLAAARYMGKSDKAQGAELFTSFVARFFVAADYAWFPLATLRYHIGGGAAGGGNGNGGSAQGAAPPLESGGTLEALLPAFVGADQQVQLHEPPEAVKQRMTMGMFGMLVTRYRDTPAAVRIRRASAAISVAGLCPFFFAIDASLAVAVAAAQGIAAAGHCDGAVGLALCANALGLIAALVFRPYNIPAKSVLLVLLNALTLLASGLTIAAIRADTDEDADNYLHHASRTAAGAAMLGFVSIGLSALRFLLLRCLVRATCVPDLGRLRRDAATAEDGQMRDVVMTELQTEARTAAAPLEILRGADGNEGGDAMSIDLTSMSRGAPEASVDGDENDDEHSARRQAPDIDQPVPSAVNAAYYNDGGPRRVQRTAHGQQIFDELEAMLGGAQPPPPDRRRGSDGSAPPPPLFGDGDDDDLLDGIFAASTTADTAPATDINRHPAHAAAAINDDFLDLLL
jgi:hypothetical protein